MFKLGGALSESSPIKVPGYVGKSMVEELQKLPQTSDHWVQYKAVIRKQANKPGCYDVRVYDEWEASQKGVKVTDYTFLDAHPELIQFSGWFDSHTKLVEIKYVQVAGQTA